MDQVLLNWKHILSTSVQKSCCFQNLFLNQQTHLLKNMSQDCKGQFTNMYGFIFSFLWKIKLLVTPFQLLVSMYIQHKVLEYYSGHCSCSEKKIIKTPPHLPPPQRCMTCMQGLQIRQIWRILCQNCSDDSTEVTEEVTSTPEIFGNKHSFVLTFFTTNTIHVNCKRCKP